MVFTIRDLNGNGRTTADDRNKTQLYLSLKCASEELKDCPKGWWIKDETTKKKVEPLA